MADIDESGEAGYIPESAPGRAEVSPGQPAGVPDDTASSRAALRHSAARPQLTRAQRVGLGLAGGAVGAAVGVALVTLPREDRPSDSAGPTAASITVSGPLQRPFPVSVPVLREALSTPRDLIPRDLGPLADPDRRASCLAGLGYSTHVDVLAGRTVDVFGRPAILLLLPGTGRGEVAAVVVAPTCDSADTGLLAETVVAQP